MRGHTSCLAALALSSIQPVTASLKAAASVPQYVYDYAPLVWLYSEDAYRPSDIGAQVANTIPEVNWKAVNGTPTPLTLDNLDSLNDLGNTSVYLTTHNGIAQEPEPSWWFGVTPNAQGQTNNATGCAIVTVDHGGGSLDAFYFYFYAFNRGDIVLGLMFGDHIGDWEHNMVRFANGTPTAVWYSQHSYGQAFTYNAVEKSGKRPYSYSGNGTHANYATAGTHDHTIPGVTFPDGPLEDYTDSGVLWDPTLNAYAYTYDPSSMTFEAAGDYPLGWLNFNGQWGDAQPSNEKTIFGQAKYVAGPNGPKFKDLDRSNVCPASPCIVWPFKEAGNSSIVIT
ncbi:hypothetical protein N7510_000720 [Penicillium lagena]|uniref:uncharacterized protein n=1 Tax=Penicillium lagena TaxID=94218 RepID=UPI002542107B|nr:uncharacterized protein N7510_000720 [Penicillium lagena]KAJ5624411.1 hypothetical protein N7510_000720 [Penicillium lagena]